MKSKPIKYNYRSKSDLCGGQLVVATMELLSWHHKGLVPSEMRPSPGIRKRLEKIFDEHASARENRLDMSHYKNLKKICCPICKELIK